MFVISVQSIKAIVNNRTYKSDIHYHNKIDSETKKFIRHTLTLYPRNKKGKNKLRKQLAENLGVSRTTIVNIELGRNTKNATQVRKLQENNQQEYS